VNDLQAVALGDEPADLAITGGLLSGETTVSPPVEDGNLVADPENGLLKATLFDRHPDSDRGGFTGFLTGFDLDSGAEKEVNLTWYTQHGDGDTDPQSVTARTPYDDSSTTVDITEADTASFEFEAVRFPGFDGETPSVNAGSSLTLNVTVKNTGPVEGTELIWLTPETSIDILDHNETELAAGEQTSFNMTWKPTRPEVDTLEVNIGADGPTERRDVIVQDPLGRVTADPIDVDISQIKIDS